MQNNLNTNQAKTHRNVKFVTILLTAVMFCMLHASSASAGKVGYINLDRLVKESSLGKKASKKIEKMGKEKQAMADARLRDIKDLKLTLSESSSGDQPKRQEIERLNQLVKEYKRLVADAKEELAYQNRLMLAEILQKADGVLKKVAKQKGFTIILKDPNAIGFLDPSVDITDAVIKALNR